MKLKAINNVELPIARGLSKYEAATYVGIGVTLFLRIGPPPIKIGGRNVYDRLDLDRWFDDYKQRGRASKEVNKWLEKEDYTKETTHRTGGSQSYSQMENEYKKALDL